MAAILAEVGKSANIPLQTFYCDDVASMNALDVSKIPSGSLCVIMDNSSVYMLNSSKVWKEL